MLTEIEARAIEALPQIADFVLNFALGWWLLCGAYKYGLAPLFNAPKLDKWQIGWLCMGIMAAGELWRLLP